MIHSSLKRILLLSCFCTTLISTGYVLGAPKTISGELSNSGNTIITPEKKEKTPESTSAEFFLALKKPVRIGLFYDDASLFRFVSKDKPLNSRNYRPENLVAIA